MKNKDDEQILKKVVEDLVEDNIKPQNQKKE